jgi:protein-S-isoprenylcysteine O-methyltransferase Ste14
MNFFDKLQVASVAVFLLIVIVRAAHMRFGRNINPIVIGGGKRGLPLAVELIAFAGLVAWVIEVLLRALHTGSHVFPPSLDIQLIDSPPAKIIGVALVTSGLVLFALAFVSFGDSWRVGFDVKAPGALVTTGIFAVTRNPIYLFLDLWFVGTFLINGTLMFLIFSVAAIAAQHWQILQEEKFLLKLYGRPYHDYCARTARYVVW